MIVSKDTVPPLSDGREDFTNPFGAAYQIVRELDLTSTSPDWDLVPHSLSCGPFEGDFGGGRPRIPGSGHGRHNLNSNPRWNRWIAPVGSDSQGYYRPSYPLHQVPIWGLQEIPEDISIGLRLDPGAPRSVKVLDGDFRTSRRPITLKDLLRGRGDLRISLLSDSKEGVPHSARLDFALQDLLPHSMYSIFAVHAISLSPPSSANFVLPVPIGLPSVLVTDGAGAVSASFVLHNPFPDHQKDAEGNRLVGIAILYLSDFQNWGAVLTSFGTGVTAHTVMSGEFTHLSHVTTQESGRHNP